MKRVLFLAIALCLFLSGATHAAPKASRQSRTPRAVLTAIDAPEIKSQPGRVIFSTWDGEEFDGSRPPIKWPKALEISGDSIVGVEIPVQEEPFFVEVRAWESLRPNGIPKGKPELSECGPPTTTGTAGGCTITPMAGPNGVGWRINFDLQRTEGAYYLAANATWDESQIAWLYHLELED